METSNCFQSRRLSLIDVSSEDDSLIASSSGNPLDFNDSELLEAIPGNKLEATDDRHDCWTPGCLPNQKLEISSTKATHKYNLRQSLAWDSAFFTNAGVLEPEELSSIMKSVDKCEKHGLKLPRIQEDINISTDSMTTLNDSLESLEAGLFDDVRASIQKSHNMTHKEKGSSKRLSEASQSRIGLASKKMDMAEHNKMKLKSVIKNSSTSLQVSGRTTKNPGSLLLSQKSVAKSKGSSLPKQSKVLQKSGPSSITSNRDSLSNLHIKSEKNNSKRTTAGSVGTVSTTPFVGGSHIAGPKCRVLTKSILGSSAATKTRSSTSSLLAEKNGKPDDNFSKSKNDSAGSILHSSSSIVKAQLKCTSRNKMQSEKSNHSSCLKSGSKHSSCSSPASSIGELSSGSSKSTSVKQKSSASSTSLDTGSCQKSASPARTPKSSDSLRNLSNKESVEWKRKQVTGYRSQSIDKNSTGLSKASGLRMPSPKIGFFDGAKSSTQTPRGVMQSHAVKIGGLQEKGERSISSNGKQNKEKVVKPQPASSVTAVVKTSISSEHRKSGGKSMEVQNSLPLGTVAGNWKSEGILGVGHNNDSNQNSAKGKDVIVPAMHNVHPEERKGNSNVEVCDLQNNICITSESSSTGNGLLSNQPDLFNGSKDQERCCQKPVDRLRSLFEAGAGKSSPGGLIDQNHRGKLVDRLRNKFEVSAINTEINKEVSGKS